MHLSRSHSVKVLPWFALLPASSRLRPCMFFALSDRRTHLRLLSAAFWKQTWDTTGRRSLLVANFHGRGANPARGNWDMATTTGRTTSFSKCPRGTNDQPPGKIRSYIASTPYFPLEVPISPPWATTSRSLSKVVLWFTVRLIPRILSSRQLLPDSTSVAAGRQAGTAAQSVLLTPGSSLPTQVISGACTSPEAGELTLFPRQCWWSGS